MSASPYPDAADVARLERSQKKKASKNEPAKSAADGLSSGLKAKRLNLNLSEKTYQRLVYLQGKTDALNATDVVREALRVYDALVSESLEGKKLALLDPNRPDEVEILRLF